MIPFRISSVTRSNFAFECGEKDFEYVPSYKYLGIWINEHLNMNKTVSELAKSADRALSALCTKCLRAGSMALDVFEKLYETLVEPDLFYDISSGGGGGGRSGGKYISNSPTW